MMSDLLDVSDAEFGMVRVGNRPSRAEEVSEMIDRFVASDMTSRRLLEKLRGRILLARSLEIHRLFCYERAQSESPRRRGAS